MIRCYECPVQDLCPTFKKTAEEVPGNSVISLPDERYMDCPLHDSCNRIATVKLKEVRGGKR